MASLSFNSCGYATLDQFTPATSAQTATGFRKIPSATMTTS
jgi:hypothetical protein